MGIEELTPRAKPKGAVAVITAMTSIREEGHGATGPARDVISCDLS